MKLLVQMSMLNDTIYVPKSILKLRIAMTEDIIVNTNTGDNSVVDVHAAMHQVDDLIFTDVCSIH